MNDLLERTIRNNAEWCARISALHGSHDRFDYSAWVNQWPAPRNYPNVVTLRSDCAAAQLDAIANLRHLPMGWGVKDSYRALDLASLGFRAAVQGRWVHHNADGPEDLLDWRVIATKLSLAQWEAAWGGAGHRGHPRIFLPDILDDASVTFFGGYSEGRLQAGGIINIASGVAGMSNVFANRPALNTAVTRHALRLANGSPLVSWQGAEEAVNGESLGLLQVWLRED